MNHSNRRKKPFYWLNPYFTTKPKKRLHARKKIQPSQRHRTYNGLPRNVDRPNQDITFVETNHHSIHGFVKEWTERIRSEGIRPEPDGFYPIDVTLPGSVRCGNDARNIDVEIKYPDCLKKLVVGDSLINPDPISS